jgi:hypothetical protein
MLYMSFLFFDDDDAYFLYVVTGCFMRCLCMCILM